MLSCLAMGGYGQHDNDSSCPAALLLNQAGDDAGGHGQGKKESFLKR
jgi:hypothetical protein